MNTRTAYPANTHHCGNTYVRVLTIIKPITRLIAVLCCILASSAVSANDNIKYYNVQGNNAKELIDSVLQNTVSKQGGFGYTAMKTRLQLAVAEQSDGQCRIDSVDFTYTVTIHMPLWTNKSSARACMQNNWDRVWGKILIHEQRHVELYRRVNANDVEAQLRLIPTQTSCEVLQQKVNSELNNILDRNDLLHDAFHAADQTPVLHDC